MLNPFPIQFLSLLAYFILRFFFGMIFVHFGFTHIHARKTSSIFQKSVILGIIEIILGSMFVLGFSVQVASLISLCVLCYYLYLRRRHTHFMVPQKSFIVLMGAVSLALCITGAGAFAFDLPI